MNKAKAQSMQYDVFERVLFCGKEVLSKYGITFTILKTLCKFAYNYVLVKQRLVCQMP